MKIIVETDVAAPVEAVWRAFNNPDDIVQWDGSADWHTTKAANDLKVGGLPELRIEDKGGCVSSTSLPPIPGLSLNRLIEWRMLDDNRIVRVEFIQTGTGVTVRQTFRISLIQPVFPGSRNDQNGKRCLIASPDTSRRYKATDGAVKPDHIRIDCHGDVWIADVNGSEVLGCGFARQFDSEVEAVWAGLGKLR